jgi:hypothetical protein
MSLGCSSFSNRILCYLLLIFIGQIAADSVTPEDWRNLEGPNPKTGNGSLSRKKRFIFPAVSPWRFDARILLFIPMVGQETQLVAFIPFTWNLNTLA